MITPTGPQEQVRDAEEKSLLITAPAGCGKTEAIALRVAGIIRRGELKPGQKILCASFTNRAKQNISERLNKYLPPGDQRQYVTVSNFHGLAARIYRAHASVIGLDPDLSPPQHDWVDEQCKEMELTWEQAASAKNALRIAKQLPLDDEGVMQALLTDNSRAAVRIEAKRVQDGILTYDDMLRLAELILSNELVRRLYQLHFGAVIVDEFQDLTAQQLRVIEYLSDSNATFAGDIAQGIYSFAGAATDHVHSRLQQICDREIPFSESHRSSPAVLAAVNSLSSLTGGSTLSCANIESWPGGGLFGLCDFDDFEAEARWVVSAARGILERAPLHRVAIMARTTKRRKRLESFLTDFPHRVSRWDDPLLDAPTARLLRGAFSSLSMEAGASPSDIRDALLATDAFRTEGDPSTRIGFVETAGWVMDKLDAGSSFADVARRIRASVETADELLSRPGLHLLTAHIGKGQQFDWGIVLGVEEGVLPDFRAKGDEVAEEARVLSVMLSRARHGAVMTWARQHPTKYGSRQQVRSHFIDVIQRGALPKNATAVRSWFRQVDWTALSNR